MCALFSVLDVLSLTYDVLAQRMTGLCNQAKSIRARVGSCVCVMGYVRGTFSGSYTRRIVMVVVVMTFYHGQRSFQTFFRPLVSQHVSQ